MSTALRHAEYYNLQGKLDNLYERSKHNATRGLDLYEQIVSKENILLAFRNIKTNKGSKTPGTDGVTIDQYKMENVDSFVEEIRQAIADFVPQTVRREMIEKENGKLRPLGIPTMRDRLIEQMFKQILEPICEAKFYNHSYGFRPNRSTHHAMARCQFLVNRTNNHYVVDVDILGFFDNINHNKLMEQLFNIGITDKRVLTVIQKMLKAPIEGEEPPTKGVVQGGVLSPLLSNVVLNDLDWWISNQWESMIADRQYANNQSKYNALKKSSLKQMFMVRYADDFKVFTNSYDSAQKIFHAIRGYLKDHLDLDISKEKSTITNLRRRKSNFLGFSLRAVKKRKGHVAYTHVADKKKETIRNRIKQLVKLVQSNPNAERVRSFNAYVLGVKNYYRVATHVNLDFAEIAYRLSKTLYNRFKSIGKYEVPSNPNATYRKLHKNNYKTYEIAGIVLYPLADIRTSHSRPFNHGICNYTPSGRQKRYVRLKGEITTEILKMLRESHEAINLEYADNKISRYSMQNGKCAVMDVFLGAEEVYCHRKTGGSDKFGNLIIVHKLVQRLITATTDETIERYRAILQLSGKQMEKLNKLRIARNLDALV